MNPLALSSCQGKTPHLKFILEAAILASHQPLSIERLSELFDEAVRPSHNELAQTLEALSADCGERGVELVEVASGFRYQIKTAVYPHVAKLWTERQSKYSRALLETLSLIAYRQPITRAEIEAVRGVAVSSHIVRTLEEREWIRVVGHREVPGRPALFGTTRGFLDYFKLKSLEDLPTLSEIKDLDDHEPELDFAPSRNTGSAASSALTPLVPSPPAVATPPSVEINLDPRLRPDTELHASNEQVSNEQVSNQHVAPEQVLTQASPTTKASPTTQAAPTTLREAAVTFATEPNHDSAMPEPSNQN